MKKEYIIPSIEVVVAQLDQEMMAGHSYGDADAKEQNLVEEDNFFNTDTRNIWADDEEE